jgi:signal transduction histidine kinase/ActR/RegA family two-component response regulator
VPIELLVHLVCDAAGKPEYYYSFVTDVTERKRAEERTRLLSDVISRLLASDSPQQIVESLCRRVMAHLDCQAFFNFLVDEQAGRLHLNACAGIPADAARQIEWLDYGVAVCGCAARDGCRIVAEQIQTTPDARTDLVRSYGIQAYACHPLLNQGRVVGTLSFGSRTRPTFAEDELALMKDVADHVAIAMQRVSLVESLQRHAQAAEAANIAKSQFLANVSHELRTPMNAIMGMTELALDEELSATLRDYLQTVKQSADGLLELVNQILDLSRIEAGGFQLEAASFDLRKTLEQVVKTLGVRAAEKGLDLACELGDAPTQLIGDSLRLRQVLINLLGNAVKFTVKGRVAVSVTVESSDAGEAVLQFAVSDTGIGIPAADQERIFAPFTQADASTTRQYGGTGLGLTISRRLVELMGGCIWLESQPGQGSTFRFTARFGREGPARCAAAAEAVATRQPAMKTAGLAAIAAKAAGRSLRVLSAEDTAANQKLVSYVLGKRGHRMEIVPDGQQALEAVGREQFDVVLMDVQMPVMDGFLATQAIRQMADRKKARLPIIAMTAHALKGDAERCLEAGMDSYISKPIKAEELIELVERLAEKGRKRTASGRIGKGRKGV